MFKKHTLLIFFTGILVFAISCSREFIGTDCRFAVFAQEMLRNGPAFFPTTYDRPYPDYSGTSTFMIYLVSLPFGKVTPLTAILPTVIVSALILVFIYKLGAMHSHQWGLYAVVLALCTEEFYGSSRIVSIDQYTSLATVISFYLAYSAKVYNYQKRLWLIPLLFIAGFAFRGPLGLIIPAGVLCVFYLCNRDYKLFSLMAFCSVILLFICSFALLAAARFQGGESFAKLVMETQVTSRMGSDTKHGLGYYWIESFGRYAIAFPFAVIVAVISFKKIFRRENSDYRFLFYLIIWILVVLIGMSIPGTKKIRYILPMIPAVALVASYVFVDTSQNNILSFIKKLYLQICTWAPAVIVIAAIACWILSNRLEFLSGANYLPVIIVSLVLALAAWLSNSRLKDSDSRNLAIMVIGTLIFIIIYAGIKVPITYKREITKPFVKKVENLQTELSAEVVFYKIGADSEAIKFMANLDKPLKPLFISNPEDIKNFNVPACFIAMKDDFESLPKEIMQNIRILESGKISNDDCIVFAWGP